MQWIKLKIQQIYEPFSMASSALPSNTDDFLGSGAYGSVFKHYDTLTNSMVAVKRINLGPVRNVDITKEVEDVHKEVSLMKEFNHKRIVQYIRAEREANILSIYMELMSGGSVNEELDKNGAMSEIQAKRYTLQLLEGLSYLHGKGIIHRDIKGSNILCDGKGNIKLADFGVSKQITRIQTLTNQTSTSMKGTAYWMAPEVIQGTKYGRRADIWSVGATLVEMLTTHPPWYHLELLPAMFKIGNLQKGGYVLDSSVSENAKRFLAKTFTAEEQRPRADKLLQHTWLIDSRVEDDDGEKRNLEIEVVSAGIGRVSLEQGLVMSQPPPLPKSMKLVGTVEVSAMCLSVCEYQGITYVGLANSAGVDRIDKNNKLTKSFLTLSGPANGITVYKDAIYTLVFNNGSYSVNVHRLTGELITSWSAHAGSLQNNKLVIMNNQVVVPDLRNQQLIIYSLTGELVTSVPCPLLTHSNIAICAADNNSVIISTYSSLVFKVDLVTGEVLWKCDQVQRAIGVTCYRSNYVLVANYGTGTTTTIWVLDMKTGKLVTTITDPTLRSYTSIYDLHISANTLIVPRHGEKKVLFYQLV